MGELELDFDRFEYQKIETMAGDTHYVKVACRHLHPEPVRSVVTGEIIAMLCPDCDQQLPIAKGSR
jgi:hypothetical protein